MNTSKRLKILVNHLISDGHFKNKTELANAMGENTASGLSELLAGNKRIRVDHLENIKKIVPEFNSNWLLTGEGDMYISPSTVYQVAEPQSTYVPGKGDISSLLEDILSRLDPEGAKLIYHLKVEIDNLIKERDKAKDEIIALVETLREKL